MGKLEVDTAWHDLQLVLDPHHKTTALVIDGHPYPGQYTRTSRPANWGSETAARFQGEVVSVYPGEQGEGGEHRAQFSDWYWRWETAGLCRTFLPTLGR